MIEISLILLVLMLIVAIENIVNGPDLRKKQDGKGFLKVSILIPARNEVDVLESCLESLVKQKYADFEIIVLNDQSTDSTGDVIKQYAGMYHTVRGVEGSPVPDGWIGKNWACWQLSLEASGDILFFTDADTIHRPDSVSHAVSWMQSRQAEAFSVFPQQITGTTAEKLLVPLIDFILYSLLPLRLIYKSSFPSLSAANGQLLVFTRRAYNSIGGHQAVKNKIVEDVELFRKAKSIKLKAMTVSGTGVVFCRMYRGQRQLMNGLTKILFGLTGNKIVALLIFTGIMFMANLYPFVYLFSQKFTIALFIPAGMVLIIRLAVALRYRHPAFISVFLHPLAVTIIIFMAFNSFLKTKWGRFEWKGRDIVLKKINHYPNHIIK
ncbi:MAG: glycosyltransferase family 2 protein [Calditrichaceae bacterium]